jgi:hypothetical protein
MHHYAQIKHLKPGDGVRHIRPGHDENGFVGRLLGMPAPVIAVRITRNGREETTSWQARYVIPTDVLFTPEPRGFSPLRFTVIKGKSTINLTFNQARVAHLRTFDGERFHNIHIPSEDIWYVISTSLDSDTATIRIAYNGSDKWLAISPLSDEIDTIIVEPDLDLSTVDKELLDHAVGIFWERELSPKNQPADAPSL